MPSVLQDWVQELPLMQQSVLITACRGPDGLPKMHVSKMLLRWLRRCFLLSAFDKCVLSDPYDPRGGSFTGPCEPAKASEPTAYLAGTPLSSPRGGVTAVLRAYLRCVDEVPHHFHLHLMHAAEILGYKHPDGEIREWWREAYYAIVNDAHLQPETEEQMGVRLGDCEETWKDARHPNGGYA